MKLGLTGRIACGKSTVSKILHDEGFRILDCDKVAHELLFQAEVKELILALFGDSVFSSNGEVMRPALGRIVFADVKERKKLEEVMRPRIYNRVNEALDTSASIVVDCFDIIGTPIQPLLDETWVVTCDREQQLERLMKRNDFDRDYAISRIDAQKSQEELVSGADVVIDNSGSTEQTGKQVWSQLVRLRKMLTAA